jgi:predicted dehydrogenase
MAMFGASRRAFSSSDFPAARVISPEDAPSLRWGILGAGEIADIFAETVLANTTQQLVAIASNTPGKAEQFAAKWNIAVAYSNYQALVERPDIDAVYVANLPHQHVEAALLAIGHRKAVLVEKPTAIHASDAERLFTAAKSAGLLAMEAMWTRYLPHIDVLRQILESQLLGELSLFQADFGQDNRNVARLWLPEASIMQDMGIYPLSLAQMIFGDPIEIIATGEMANKTNEAMAVVRLRYSSSASAVITVSGHTYLPTRASLSGSDGLLTIAEPFFVPSSLSLAAATFNPKAVTWNDLSGIVGHLGLSYQVNHFASYFAQGLLESPLHTHADTLAVLAQGEEIKRQLLAESGSRPS